MSTTTAARAQSRSTSPQKARTKHRSLPERALLVELGTVDAMGESVAAAAKPLTRPTDARRDIAKIRKRLTDGMKRLERRGERANTQLRRDVTRARDRFSRRASRRRAH